jgi:hypothetical protein
MLENTPEEFRESIGEYWGPELREKNYGFVWKQAIQVYPVFHHHFPIKIAIWGYTLNSMYSTYEECRNCRVSIGISSLAWRIRTPNISQNQDVKTLRFIKQLEDIEDTLQ